MHSLHFCIECDSLPGMAPLLGRLAAAAAGHWKRSLALVVAVLLALGGLAAGIGGDFSAGFRAPGTDSERALDLLEQRFPAQAGDTATLVFAVDSGSLRDGARASAIARTASVVRRQRHVTGVAAPRLSGDGRVGFVTVQYDKSAQDLRRAPGERLAGVAPIGSRAGIEVSRRGAIVDEAENASAPVGELLGVAAAVLVLTLVFRSVAAMLLTLIASLLSLAGGLLLMRFGTAFTDIPSITPTLAVMLGLGAGIDYALLIVGRYREQLGAGGDVVESARVANRTAGTSVLAAGSIVVVALTGLLATGIPFVGRLGIGTALVVASVAVGAVTVLPALMGAFARRLRPRRVVVASPGFERWGRRVAARPWLAAAAGTLVLIGLALPALGMRLGQPDDGNDRAGSTTRVAYDRLAEGFGAGFNGPLVIAVSGSESAARVRSLAARTRGVAFVSAPVSSPRGDAATLTVIPRTSPQDPRTSELVERLRATLPAGAYVGGATATLDDLAGKLAARLPFFIALVIGLSILLLMLAFRSIWVPLVSGAFNLLSIGAAYGVVVAVFQHGWGASLLGVSGEVPIVSFVPVFMFAILFGLSMDYNVFLIARVREERSVVRALARVGRIIVAAGAIMTAVFLGFTTDPDVVVKTFGVGLASAILIDVLVVRMLVAPAVLTLLGERAWALPAWLDRALPRIALEGEPEPASS
jgi:putative drug exporter of the RND superfamily